MNALLLEEGNKKEGPDVLFKKVFGPTDLRDKAG